MMNANVNTTNKTLNRLYQVIDAFSGFELVLCSYRSLSIFEDINDEIHARCSKKENAVIDVNVSTLDDIDQFETMLLELMGDESRFRVFVVSGLEQFEKDEQVSRFFNHLNLIREQLAVQFPYPFCLCLPDNLLKPFAHDAPNLWAGCKSKLFFDDNLKKRPSTDEFRPVNRSYKEYLELPLDQKERELEALEKYRVLLLKEKKSKLTQNRLLNNSISLYNLYLQKSDFDKALEYVEASLKIIREFGDKQREAMTLSNISHILINLGDYDRAEQYLEKSVQISRELGDKSLEGTALNNLAGVAFARGDLDKAMAYLETDLKFKQQLRDTEGKGHAFYNIAQIYGSRGDYDKAIWYLEKELKTKQPQRDKARDCKTLDSLSQLYSLNGDKDKALKCLEKTLKLREEMGDLQGESMVLEKLAKMAFLQGDYEKSQLYLDKNLQILQALGNRERTAHIFHNYATIYFEKQDWEKFLQYETDAYRIAEEFNNLPLVYSVGWSLGKHLYQTGDPAAQKSGLDMLKRSLEIGKPANYPKVDELEKEIQNL